MAEELTDLEIATQLEQLWLKINEGIALANGVLDKSKLLDEAVSRKQQEAIADLESRYQEVLRIQSSLPDLHQEFLELGDIKRNLKSLVKDVNRSEDISNFAAEICQLKDEVNRTKSEGDRLKTKLAELEVKSQEIIDVKPAIADRTLQEHSALISELKDLYNHAFSNLKRIENQTLETFDRLTVRTDLQTEYINKLVTQLEDTLQTQQDLKNELETKCDRITQASQQLQANLDLVNAELAIQGMKQVEQIHLREERGKEELAKFAEILAMNLNSNLQKENFQQEIASADRAISQIVLQRQELQRELASTSTVIQRLNQTKINSATSSLSSSNPLSSDSDELLNKLKTIEQKYDRLRQSVWWLGIGIGVASGMAIAFGRFIFR